MGQIISLQEDTVHVVLKAMENELDDEIQWPNAERQ
jgi:hypothetical protein